MAEYIEREAAKRRLALDYAYAAADLLDEVDTADVEPIKRGYWMPQTLLGERVWDCSECKTLGSPHWKRCPVCEAKMEVK